MTSGKDYDWFQYGKCRLSQYNQCKAVQEMMPNLPEKVFVRDITMKAGATHEPGCFLDVKSFLKYVEKVVEAGVPELDCGRCYSPLNMEIMRQVKKAGLNIKLCPAVGEYDRPGVVLDKDHYHKYIDVCFKNGADIIKLLWESGSMMPPLVRTKEHLLRGLDVIADAIDYIHTQYKTEVSLSTADNVRLPMETQLYFHKKMIDADVDRIWISDEGHANPLAFKYVVSKFREYLGDNISFAFHVHDAWGLGVTNALAGVEVGGPSPVYLDLSVNGIGLAQPIDEMVLALEFLYGVNTGIKLDKLYKLNKAGEEATGISPSWFKLHSGKTVHITKAGSIVAGVRAPDERHAVDPIGVFSKGGLNPEVFGGLSEKRAWWGENPLGLIKEALEYLDLEATDANAEKIRDWLENEYRKEVTIIGHKQYVMWEEFAKMAREMIPEKKRK